MQAVAQLGGVEGGVRAAAARDHDAGGGDARDARHAEQLPVVRSHGSRRLGSVPGLALDDAIATSATGDLWLFRGRSLADRAIQTFTNAPVNHVGMVVALDELRRCSGTPSSAIAARRVERQAPARRAAACCATRWGCGARSTTSARICASSRAS